MVQQTVLILQFARQNKSPCSTAALDETKVINLVTRLCCLSPTNNPPKPSLVKHLLRQAPWPYRKESLYVDKHSSLFGVFVDDRKNTFYTLTPAWDHCRCCCGDHHLRSRSCQGRERKLRTPDDRDRTIRRVRTVAIGGR